MSPHTDTGTGEAHDDAIGLCVTPSREYLPIIIITRVLPMWILNIMNK
jgi:hypothetical protein